MEGERQLGDIVGGYWKMEKMDDTLDRLMRLTEEYKRFADYFNGIQNRVIEQNEDDEYVSVHTRLMLLRKYGQKNDFNLSNNNNNFTQFNYSYDKSPGESQVNNNNNNNNNNINIDMIIPTVSQFSQNEQNNNLPELNDKLKQNNNNDNDNNNNNFDFPNPYN